MPTRYNLELEGLKGVVTADTFKEVSQREDAKKTVKKAFEERYTSGKNRWFFTPLSKLPRGSKPLSTPNTNPWVRILSDFFVGGFGLGFAAFVTQGARMLHLKI